jgi:hypothetical protein
MINLKNNLFNENSIKKYSNNFILTQEKRIKLERYIERVQNNEFKGETKGYLAFLKFLEDILDYEEDKHISFDDNVDIGSDRVEFALKDNDGKFMVIELKGQNADLDKPQNRANDKRSPVEQAFGYAQHSSKKSGLVQWILVSNYKEFRLYNYDKRLGESISFNVEDLLNEEIFKTFMFAFSKESHVDLKSINDVVNENYIEKTQLANNFYKLFNETRLMIFKELNELHGMDKNDAISNAQTILDRFIFICFASSRELLPENIARKTLMNRIKSEDIRDHEIWRDLNYLFIDVDIGNNDRNISKYNGGLFKEDLEVIKLKDIIKDTNFFKDVYQKWNFKEFEERLEKEIKPSILKRINPIYINLLIISYFDFSEESTENIEHKLDIEILGHIFENSIGDLEELKEDSKGRRKKDGIFYTPDHITDYICKNTIIPYLSISGNVNTVEGLLEEYSTGREIEKLDKKLKNIKIVDPACGSGAFLNKSTDILLEIHNWIFNIKKGYTTSQPMRVGKGNKRRTENVKFADLGVYVFDALSKRREILLDNIYGVDLNPESVEITKLSLFLKVCEKDKILPAIDKNILCGNSLIDDSEFTDKPFNWKEKFENVFKEGGFGIVIGNPPYVRHQKIVASKPYLKENYETYTGRSDLYVYFFEKGLDMLKENGIFSFICSNKFIWANYGKPLRKMILRYQIKDYVDYTNQKVFQDATVDPCVIIIKKELPDVESTININKEFIINQNRLSEGVWNFKNPEILNLKEKIISRGLKLCEIEGFKILKGILTGYNKAFVIDENTKNEIISIDRKSKDVIKPLINGKDIKKWKIDYRNLYLLYIPWGFPIEDYPAIKDHLLKYKEGLTARTEVINGNIDWFVLRRFAPDYYKKFEDPKIIYPEISSDLFMTYTENTYFMNNKCFMITEVAGYDLKFLSALLSSKTLNFTFKLLGSPLGNSGYELLGSYIEQLPIYPASPENQTELIKKTDRIIQLNNELNSLTNSFKKYLNINFNLEEFSKKLESYYNLSEKDLFSELKKKNVKLNARKIREISEEFKNSRNAINPLLLEIERTDDEIDHVVYDLYDLSKEEIKIIEDNI